MITNKELKKIGFKKLQSITNYKNVCWIPIHIQNQAKEMEKQQIIESYRNGRCDQQSARKSNFYNRMAEQYYNETFKMNKDEKML